MTIVETPTQPPHQCLRCGEIHGLVDTGIDIEGIGIPASMMVGRLYLCRRVCAREMARTCGFAPGKNLDQLIVAAEQLEAAEKAIDESNKRLADSEANAGHLAATLEGYKEKLSLEQSRSRQLHDALSQEAKEKLAVLG